MNRPQKPEWQHRAIIFLCALAAVVPLAIHGNSCGHDFDFHIQSWLAVAQQWGHGTLYPSWIEAANYGAGEPRFVFYPPLSWMLGAILGTILPWNAAPIGFTLIVLTACGLSMNKLARQWLNPNAATVAACVYILNPYALFVAYERTAYAELAAGIWFPLTILYALRNDSDSWHPDRSAAKWKDLHFQLAALSASIIPLALTVAAIWLTNAPAAVMACYSLGAITVWKSIAQKRWQPIFDSAAALILGLGIAAFYILPAAYERRWVDITRAIGPGMRIQDSFLFSHTGESFHDEVLRVASLIIVTMIVAICFSMWIVWRRKATQSLVLPLSVTAAAVFSLQLPWSNILWRIAPELRFLQFPWRWTLILSIAFALSLGAAAAKDPTKSSEPRFRHTIAILIVAITVVALAAHFFWQPCDEEDAVSAQVAVFQANTGFEGTDEYTTIGADNSIIQQGLPALRLLNTADAETAAPGSATEGGNPPYIPTDKDYPRPQAKIDQWLPNRKAMTITAQSPGYAIVRLMDYPAWQVFANGVPVRDRPHRDDGLMTIPIQIGFTHIAINYVSTPDVWCGRVLSATSLIGLAALALQKRHKLI